MNCECKDPGCPIHKGISKCEAHGEYTLHRVDQTDETGTKFCDACGCDAASSGVFMDWEDGKKFNY